MKNDITITKELADRVIFSVYKTNISFAHDVDRCLKRWEFGDAESDEDIKRQIYLLTDLQTETILFKIADQM